MPSDVTHVTRPWIYLPQCFPFSPPFGGSFESHKLFDTTRCVSAPESAVLRLMARQPLEFSNEAPRLAPMLNSSPALASNLSAFPEDHRADAGFDLAAHGECQRRFGNLYREVSLLCAPVAKGRSEAVWHSFQIHSVEVRRIASCQTICRLDQT